MNRRTFFTAGVVAAATALAGCQGESRGDDNYRPPGHSDNGEEDDITAEPLPGAGYVDALLGVDNSAVSIRLHGVDWPRQVTLELYAEIATESTPPGDWAFNSVGTEYPVLNYPDETEEFIDEQIAQSDGDSRQVINFEHKEMPAGVPIQYNVYLREHLHTDGDEADDYSGDTRRLTGATSQVVRRPGENEYTISDVGQRSGPGLGGRDEYEHHEDGNGDHHVTAIGSTNNTRFHTPMHETYSNRSTTGVGLGRNGHHRGAFERLWGLDYTVTADEFETAHEHNRLHYVESYSSGDEERELIRMFRDYLHGEPVHGADETIVPIKRVADKLATKADELGLDTPEEQVRLVMDFVQWLPYEHDNERIQRGVPRVQHPTVTLARAQGDCEDKVVLMASILYQYPFPDFVMHMYHLTNEYSSAAPHWGLAIKNDIFTVDTGGPTANNLDQYWLDDVEPDDYTYFEATYPAAIGVVHEGYSGLRFIDRPFPSYD